MRTRSLVLLLAVMVCFAGYVQAADTVSVFGVPNSSGVPPMKVDTDRVITIAPTAGLIQSYEAATTSDTITAAECGKTFVVNSAAGKTPIFTLPDADVGCGFRFIQSDGSYTGLEKIVLNPQDTDTFRGVINSSAATTFAAGDSVSSPGVTGDSITIFCGEDTYWDVVQKTGTFTDSN